ncbi:type I-F CRISPR-associated endoribonuclease Cas6/Csy4 [Aquirhabdus sp.]|uniref:type I-F CRISPR-associated endoribonuclease Cas6/Csy4 n=1 Tax=Aquirhabdus sp. TaxID=2824160 RepID=UPI00396C609C
MKHFTEVTLLPNPEVGIHFLWSKVYIQLHLALVEIKGANSLVPVGVSFAEYRSDGKHHVLGSKLRVFATDVKTLETLNLKRWFDRLSDYVHVSSIRDVPSEHGHVAVSRIHAPANAGNLARRYAKRHGISLEDALLKYQTYQSKPPIHLPFIKIRSLSNAESFTLCIQQSAKLNAQSGFYSTYGLSHTSTVPHW